MLQMLLVARCRCNHPFSEDLVRALSSENLLSHTLTLNLGTGVSCQAWLSGELFLQCYTDQSPVEDVVHCICKSALLVGMSVITQIFDC